MASELRVNTLKDASGNNSVATSVVFGGTAKFWIKPAADLASISDSYNVSSLDDDGTGNGGVNFSNAMSKHILACVKLSMFIFISPLFSRMLVSLLSTKPLMLCNICTRSHSIA